MATAATAGSMGVVSTAAVLVAVVSMAAAVMAGAKA
jgi:hypothetical protein